MSTLKRWKPKRLNTMVNIFVHIDHKLLCLYLFFAVFPSSLYVCLCTLHFYSHPFSFFDPLCLSAFSSLSFFSSVLLMLSSCYLCTSHSSFFVSFFISFSCTNRGMKIFWFIYTMGIYIGRRIYEIQLCAATGWIFRCNVDWKEEIKKE